MPKQRVRIVIILYMFCAFLVILFGRLFYLSVIENDEWSRISKNLAVKTSVMAAPRGEILDRYGKVIAGSKRAYVIKLMRVNLKDDEINKSSVSLVKTLKKNKDHHVFRRDICILIFKSACPCISDLFYRFRRSLYEFAK